MSQNYKIGNRVRCKDGSEYIILQRVQPIPQSSSSLQSQVQLQQLHEQLPQVPLQSTTSTEIESKSIPQSSSSLQSQVQLQPHQVPVQPTTSTEIESKSPLTIKKDKYTWSDRATKTLLVLYKEEKSKSRHKTQKALWQAIAAKMKENGREEFEMLDETMVENKFKSLLRAYKNMTSHNKKTGRNRKTCAYEEELEELFGHKDNIHPKVIMSSTSGIQFRKYDETETENTAEELICEEDVDDPGVPGQNKHSDPDVPGQNKHLQNQSNQNSQKPRHRAGYTEQALKKCTSLIENFISATNTRKEQRKEFEDNLVKMYQKEIESAEKFRHECLNVLKKNLE